MFFPRPICALTVSAALLGACAAPPELALTPLATNVWVHSSYRDVPRIGPVLSQGLVVATPEGSLIVDTAWTDADTVKLLAEVRAHVSENVRAVVVTHAHADKMGGLRAVNAAGIRSFAHPFSNQDAPARGLALASDTLFADGSDAQTLAGAEIFHPGAGHARDNIVVYFAPARVLFGGCLVRPADAVDLGNSADGDIAHWAAAVRAVAARFPDARIVVPSHGAVGGRELLDHTIALAEAAAPR